MRQIGDMDIGALERRLKTGGVIAGLGAFRAHIHSQVPGFARDFHDIYAGYPILDPREAVADFGVHIDYTAFWRRFLRPSVAAYCDVASPFVALPGDLAFVSAEMGLNWQVAMGTNTYLLIHASIVADAEDRAIIMPGASGSGKSTMAAAMAQRGWRLLGDEFAMLDLSTGLLHPHLRPVSLKNEAIGVMRAAFPEARFSRPFAGTTKGTIVYMTPPQASLAAAAQTARPALAVYPKFRTGAEPRKQALEADDNFMRLVAASVNYPRLGAAGFRLMTGLAKKLPAYEISYGGLEDGMELVTALLAQSLAGTAAETKG